MEDSTLISKEEKTKNVSFEKNPEMYNYFLDGKHRVDYIIVYKKVEEDYEYITEGRFQYEKNLKENGLLLEKYIGADDDTTYVKIHVPLEVLKFYCEVLKMQMPVKDQPESNDKEQDFKGFWNIKRPRKKTAIYTKNKENIFDDKDESFFSTSDRCKIVNHILETTKGYFYKELPELTQKKIYEIAYAPLEDTHEPGQLMKIQDTTKNMISSQPINNTKCYFGTKLIMMTIILIALFIGLYIYLNSSDSDNYLITSFHELHTMIFHKTDFFT